MTMINRLFLVIIIFVLCSSCNNNSKDMQEIVACFEGYKEAAKKSDGSKALEFLSKNTVQFYTDMLNMVLLSDSTQLMELWSFYKIMITVVRCEVPKEELLKMSGEDLIIYAVEHDMIDMQAIQEDNFKIGSTTITANTAKAKLLHKGKEVPMSIDFYKEDSKWKIDVPSILNYVIPEIEKELQAKGYDNSARFEWLLLVAGCDSPQNPIWKPVVDRSEKVSPGVLNFFDSSNMK